MATYALLKFKINNSFSEWEQAFYASQPMARKAGLIELFHGMSEEDPQTVHVLVHVHSKESMDKFMQEAGEDIAKSGHVLESTEVTFLTKLYDSHNYFQAFQNHTEVGKGTDETRD